MAVQCRLKLLEKALELVQMEVKTRHVLDEQVSKTVLVHQLNQQTKSLFLRHL